MYDSYSCNYRDKDKRPSAKQKVLQNYLFSRLFLAHFVMADSSRCWKMTTTRRQQLQIYQAARSCAQPTTYIYYFKKPYIVEFYSKFIVYWTINMEKKYVKVVRLKIAKNTSYRKYCADGEEKRPDLWHWIRWHKAFYGHDLFEVQEPFSISW